MSGQPKQHLNDVYVIRPLAIFLLVVWHSFIIYTGGWKEPIDFTPVPGYWWLAKASYAFMLELFVFISGYVFGLSLQKKNLGIKSVAIGKLKRLIIPSILFSIIYYLLFYNLSDFSILSFIYDIINGCGHMWFLPMLFWTTIIAYVIDKIDIHPLLKLVGVCCFPLLSIIPAPLRLSTALYYIPFFYAGILVYRNRDAIINKICSRLSFSVLIGSILVVVFISTTFLNRDILPILSNSDSIIVKGVIYACKRYSQLICAVCGIAFIYSIVNYLIHVKKIQIPKWFIELNATCFGVYLFQQFILQILYYKTSLPSLAGSYWLPWVGLVVTLILSYLLTKLSLKTKIGRQMM